MLGIFRGRESGHPAFPSLDPYNLIATNILGYNYACIWPYDIYGAFRLRGTACSCSQVSCSRQEISSYYWHYTLRRPPKYFPPLKVILSPWPKRVKHFSLLRRKKKITSAFMHFSTSCPHPFPSAPLETIFLALGRRQAWLQPLNYFQVDLLTKRVTTVLLKVPNLGPNGRTSHTNHLLPHPNTLLHLRSLPMCSPVKM